MSDYRDYDRYIEPRLQRKIYNNILEVHRGDYFEIPLFINLGDRFDIKQYILRPLDKVYVSIAEPNQMFEDSLIKKVLTYEDLDEKGNPLIKLLPCDTEFVVPGKYFLEIKIQLGNHKTWTLFPKRQFWVVE